METARVQLSALAFQLVDEMLGDLQARVDAGQEITQHEAQCLLLQLVADRAKLQAFMDRGASTIQ